MPARLIADENVPAKAIEALRSAGLDVLSVREHSPGITDDEVLRLAVAQHGVLVTFDRDYGELIFGRGLPSPPSVIYFRIIPRDSREVSDAVLALLADRDPIDGAMIVVSRQGVRRRRFHRVGR